MQLVSLERARWRIDLRIEATHGLMWLAGLDLQQSTVFDATGANTARSARARCARRVFSASRPRASTTGRAARAWTGDVKKTRERAVTAAGRAT